MKRREFITLVGGAAAWPLAARAQQGERMRRIGVLMNVAAADPDGQAQIAAFLQALQQLGWNEGRNLRIDFRWGGNDMNTLQRFAKEIVASKPDVIFSSGSPTTRMLKQGNPHHSHRLRQPRRSGRPGLRR